jgi:2-octaprenyl-6-methoxyphenol hydroxylase
VRREYDVAIAGGGPVGLTLALALTGTRYRVALLESAPPRTSTVGVDSRGLAFSPASVRVFEALRLWDRIARCAAPIRRIHVSEAGRFGCVRLDAAALGVEWLGQVVAADELGRLLSTEASGRENVEVLRPAHVARVSLDGSGVTLGADTADGTVELRCRLLVAADGARSTLRGKLGINAAMHDYGQTAVVAAVTPARAHAGTAWERFSAQGPTALLPLPDGRCTAVLCVTSINADAVLALPDREFLEFLDARSGRRLGGFSAAGKRSAWPLQRVVAVTQRRGRALLLGNAAHTMHPNAAQGLNLALRDIAALAERLAGAGDDPGAAEVLDGYVAAREPDQQFVLGFTHGLAELFCTESCGRTVARRVAMLLTERAPPLKRALTRRAAGLYGRQPTWVRGAAW